MGVFVNREMGFISADKHVLCVLCRRKGAGVGKSGSSRGNVRHQLHSAVETKCLFKVCVIERLTISATPLSFSVLYSVPVCDASA